MRGPLFHGTDRTKFTHYFTERNGRHTLIEQSSYYNTLIEQSSYIAQAIAKLPIVMHTTSQLVLTATGKICRTIQYLSGV